MNKVVLEESFKTLNEQDLKEADFRTVRNKVYDFLEHFYNFVFSIWNMSKMGGI